MQAGRLLAYQVPMPPELDEGECVEHYVQDYLVEPEGKIQFKGFTTRFLASGDAFEQDASGAIACADAYVSAGLGLAAKCTVRQVRALVDTGADISVLSREAARWYTVTPFAPDEQPEIRQADGSALVWEGFVEVHLFLCGQLYPHIWYVPAENSCTEDYGAIIGTDLLAAMGMLIVDFDKSQISLKNRRTKSTYIFRTADRRCIIEPQDPRDGPRRRVPPPPPGPRPGPGPDDHPPSPPRRSPRQGDYSPRHDSFDTPPPRDGADLGDDDDDAPPPPSPAGSPGQLPDLADARHAHPDNHE
jgi:hypothetical protein